MQLVFPGTAHNHKTVPRNEGALSARASSSLSNPAPFEAPAEFGKSPCKSAMSQLAQVSQSFTNIELLAPTEESQVGRSVELLRSEKHMPARLESSRHRVLTWLLPTDHVRHASPSGDVENNGQASKAE